MFMQASGPSLCDSRTTSYFDRPTARISRYRSDGSYTSTTSSTMTRKRPRVDSSYNNIRTPRHSTSTHHLDDSTSSFGLVSPSPLVNTDYHLFGGLDTPGTWSEQREERARIEDAERDYRHNRCITSTDQSFFSDPSASTTLKSQDDSNTDMSASTTLSGWHLRRTAWALTGGLAGKIFNFCWNTTFRGFQAGGGQSYTIHDADDTDFAQDGHRFDPGRSPRLGHQSRHSLSGNIPQYHQPIDNRPHQTRNHPSQNQLKTPISHQRSKTLDDSTVKNNWVFVETNPTSPSEDHSPVRKRSRASVASPSRPSQNYNNTNIPQPTMTGTSRTYTASFASPRPTRTSSINSRTYSYNSGYTHTRNNSYTNTTATSLSLSTSPKLQSSAHSPKPKRPRVSMPSSQSNFTSPTKPKTQSLHILPQSPVSPEIESFQRKRRKEAKSLKRLNATLQGLIREGNEALGMRVEVFEYGDGDGGEESEMEMEMEVDGDDGGETEMERGRGGGGGYFGGGMR